MRRSAIWLAYIAVAAGLTGQAPAEDFLAYVAGNVHSPMMGVDAQGHVYIAGVADSSGFDFQNPVPLCPAPPCRDEIATRKRDVVIVKLEPATGEILYRTYLSTSGDESVSAMAVSPEGMVYLAGYSSSADLPVTPNALFPYSSRDADGAFLPFSYLARIDASGTFDYVSYLGEIPWNIRSMVLTPAGELLLSGGVSRREDRLTATPGAIDATASEPSVYYVQPFILKLNRQADEILFRAVGVGGQLALGPDGSIYVAGATAFPGDYPTTPAAFQPTFSLSYCGSLFFAFPCGAQYVTKIDSEATRILYSTFIAAGHGASPGGFAVDREGHAYLTGATSSREYPVTEGALQPENRSQIPRGFRGYVRAHNAYVTKVAPDGSALVYSTYLGGIGGDTGAAIAVDSQGIATVAGVTSSRDFPGSPPAHPRCQPNDLDPDEVVYQEPYPFWVRQAFATRIAANGSAVLGTQLVRGAWSSASGLIVDDDGAVLVVGETDHHDLALTPNVTSAHPEPARTHTGVFLARVEFDEAQSEPDIDCVVNAATLGWVEGVPGGQLLTLFGANTGITGEHSLGLEPDGRAPTVLGGARVLFDGQPGFLLYAGPRQINVQAPHDPTPAETEPGAGDNGPPAANGNGNPPSPEKATVRMDVEVNGAIIHSRVFTRTKRNPAVFVHVDQHQVDCGFGEGSYGGIYPLGVILNEDGSLNSCENPAGRGSTISFFLTGAGVNPPGVVEGAIHAQPLAPLPVPVVVNDRISEPEITFAGGAEGHISGVWRISIRLPEHSQGAVALSVKINDTPAEPLEFTAWVRP